MSVGTAQALGKGSQSMSRVHRFMAGKDQGFTLIELLVVIIIIGILAAIAIPVFLNQRKKAVDASMKSDLHNAAVIMETWAVDNPGGAVTAQEGWYAPGAAGGLLDGLKVSPGNYIALTPSGTARGWCLFAENPKASTADWLVYKSLHGGLDLTTTVASC